MMNAVEGKNWLLASADLDYLIDLSAGASCACFRRKDGSTWLHANQPTPEFAVGVDGRLTTSCGAEWDLEGTRQDQLPDGSFLNQVILLHRTLGLRVASCCILYPGACLVEKWCEVENAERAKRTITRLDSIHLLLAPGDYLFRAYDSEWAKEFAPVEQPLTEAFNLEVRTGRASNGAIPWFGLANAAGGILTAAVAWPGNWIFRFAPLESGGWSISGGLHDWEFSMELSPGEKIAGAHVFLALGEGGDWDSAAGQFHRWSRLYTARRSRLAMEMPVEWNHWWPYEDVEITGEIFTANVDRAADLGVDVATLDAGWFGPSDETHWYDYRGDWDLVNGKRFPEGLRTLADHVHGRGLKFGLWCEIQAAGAKTLLHEREPDLIARRDGESLGYICLANPAARRWAVGMLDTLITRYDLDWVKFDFNLDPGAGCNRDGHGHGAGDGLYHHFQGYIGVIDEIRRRHPRVLCEACAGGGLCLNLEFLRHFDCLFLSDPDYPVHNLQVFWGALDLASPDAFLHWCWSQTRGVYPSFNPCDPGLTRRKLDYVIRTGMLGRFGISWRLPELPAWVVERLAMHIQIYRSRIAPLVRTAEVFRLTGQPLRDGGGDRWCAFEYLAPAKDNGVVFIFRLPGGESTRLLKLRGLIAEREYRLVWYDAVKPDLVATGDRLMDPGLIVEGLAEEESVLVDVYAI